MGVTIYSDEVKAKVLDLIAEGLSLRDIARREGMPSPNAVQHWARTDDDFAVQYARAMEARMDVHAEEILEIADDATNDWMERNNPDNPGWTANGEHIQRSRLRVDARKWLMSKLAPKKYGDKLVNEHTGKDGEPIAIVDAGQRAAFMLEKAARQIKKVGPSDQ